MQTQTIEMLNRVQNLGFTLDEALKLRRIAMTFHRWDEAECGDGNDYASWAIERDEESGKPYRCIYPHKGEMRRYKIADREKGAQKRLDAIMARHPELVAYHQGDCRGASLYILKRSDLNGTDINSTYTRGVAIYQ
jgi:hypothetical protein